MPYDLLIQDLLKFKSAKKIGTDKGLAKIGDAVVNLAYSVAKSMYLTKINSHNQVIRTGEKVNRKILSIALKNAKMKDIAKSRADAHDLADSVEALIAYIWLNDKMTLNEIIDVLTNNLTGNIYERAQEIQAATNAFTNLLNHVKKFITEN
jgi:hypothetical protein